MLKDFISETLTNNVNYTALVLDDESHKLLSKFSPEGWKVFSHHMTIISPPEQKGISKIDKSMIGKFESVSVVAIAKNDKVVAAKVVPKNKEIKLLGPSFPHITIAVNVENGGKPMMSNNFKPEDFESIKSFDVSGTIEEIFK